MAEHDILGDKLYIAHAAASAEERIKREEFFVAVRSAYQEPKEAENNIAWAFGRWGTSRTIDTLENDPDRFGTLRGAWYTADRWKEGGQGRAETASEAKGQLAQLARELLSAQDRERATWSAYLRYCHETGRDPERAPDWSDDPRSMGAARVPDSIVERDTLREEKKAKPERRQNDDLDWLRDDLDQAREAGERASDRSRRR